jgi:hypothetical protein
MSAISTTANTSATYLKKRLMRSLPRGRADAPTGVAAALPVVGILAWFSIAVTLVHWTWR